MMLVVLDSNVLVSALIKPSGPPGQCLNLVITGHVQACTTSHLWEELLRALSYSKVRQSIVRSQGDEVVSAILKHLRTILRVVPEEPPAQNWIPMDEDDNWVIQCALTAKADRIVSGDRHLTLLNQIENIPIVSPLQFLRELEAQEGPQS